MEYYRDNPPLPAIGHMPFIGHRTQRTIRLQREAAVKRVGSNSRLQRMIDYGYDPRLFDE